MKPHSKGPYRVIDNGSYLDIKSANKFGEIIANVCPSKFLTNGDNEDANAHLLAASPTMYEAISAVLRDTESTLSHESKELLSAALDLANTRGSHLR